jgi:hypothetical protein
MVFFGEKRVSSNQMERPLSKKDSLSPHREMAVSQRILFKN